MVKAVSTPKNKVIPKPQMQRKVQAYTVAKLLSLSLAHPDKEMAKWVSVQRITKLRDVKGRPVWRCDTVTIHPNTPPKRGHQCSFRPAKEGYSGKITDCKAVEFSCNCERWLFTWEYAMWYRGAAVLLHSNGEYPIQTNPMLRPGLCKHGIVLARELISKKL